MIELEKKLWLKPWFYGTGNYYANIRCKIVSTKCKVCNDMSNHKLLSTDAIKQLKVLMVEIKSQKTSSILKIGNYKEQLEQMEETNVLLKSQMESIQKMQCVICYERSETVFVPCGHLCCSTCYNKLPLGNPCPSCRRSIQQFQRIYIQ
ncbi:E3 ubiquitin-protein ligase LRSAM1 isoform X2 [Aphelenchoides besseyi]|nr:E3 ubiquitin-protein ligase LRSAM1 isoform X2 [Aphelenchoides besseyi]